MSFKNLKYLLSIDVSSLFYLIHEHLFFAKKKIGSLQTIESTMPDIGPKWVFENIEINNSLSLKRNKNKFFVV